MGKKCLPHLLWRTLIEDQIFRHLALTQHPQAPRIPQTRAHPQHFLQDHYHFLIEFRRGGAHLSVI